MAESLFSIMATMPSGKQRLVSFYVDANPDESEDQGNFAWGVFERIEGDEESDEIVFTAATESECNIWCEAQINSIHNYVNSGRFDDY